MGDKNFKGKVNSDVYEDGKGVNHEYKETGKLDFDFLLGRHILHLNTLMSQDILGDTIAGNNLGIQKCEVALDILSNMLEVYTEDIPVVDIAERVLSLTEITKMKKDLLNSSYYEIYQEIRYNKYNRYCSNKDKSQLSKGQKEIDKLNFRFTQLSNIHRYLILWINECGLTPVTVSMNAEIL